MFLILMNWEIGHKKWFLNTNLFQFVIYIFYFSLEFCSCSIWFHPQLSSKMPLLLKRIQAKQSTFWRPYQVHGSSLFNCTRIECSFVTLTYQSLSHSELEEEDLISLNTKLDTTRPSSISRYEPILTNAIVSWQCQQRWPLCSNNWIKHKNNSVLLKPQTEFRFN